MNNAVANITIDKLLTERTKLLKTIASLVESKSFAAKHLTFVPTKSIVDVDNGINACHDIVSAINRAIGARTEDTNSKVEEKQ